jgi:nitroreductase
MLIAEFLRLARMRRTVRRYTADPVSREAIENVVEAARWAPSAMNAQPLRYVVVQDPAQRQRLAQAVQNEVARFVAQGFTARVPDYLATVPVMVAVVADPAAVRSALPGQRGGVTGEKIYQSSVAAAMQNVHLAAAAQGLGSVWFTVSCDEETQAELRAVLGLPAGLDVPYLIPIGHPAEPLGEPAGERRKPAESLVRWETFSGSTSES